MNIIFSYFDEVIRYPDSENGWKEIVDGFYENTGFPGIVGCMDGFLIKINKFSTNIEGWIDRKGRLYGIVFINRQSFYECYGGCRSFKKIHVCRYQTWK
jgi:hypothetical protein